MTLTTSREFLPVPGADSLIGRARDRLRDRAAQRAALWAETVWLDEARRAAGLPVDHGPLPVPENYPPIPPVTGDATRAAAHRYEITWTQLHELARDGEEAAAFHRLARHWSVVRGLADSNGVGGAARA
jgi:hypothetical protein